MRMTMAATQIAAVVLSGLILGKLYQCTGTLLVPILAHLLMNLPQLAMVLKRLHRLGKHPLPLPMDKSRPNIVYPKQ